MADKDTDLMAEFQEFLTAKREREQSEAESEDYDVEIWDEKGRGARVRRSHAKPFLQTLGIDIDASDGEGDDKSSDDKGGDSPKSGRKSTGSKSASNAAGGVARKYFTKKS